MGRGPAEVWDHGVRLAARYRVEHDITDPGDALGPQPGARARSSAAGSVPARRSRGTSASSAAISRSSSMSISGSGSSAGTPRLSTRCHLVGVLLILLRTPAGSWCHTRSNQPARASRARMSSTSVRSPTCCTCRSRRSSTTPAAASYRAASSAGGGCSCGTSSTPRCAQPRVQQAPRRLHNLLYRRGRRAQNKPSSGTRRRYPTTPPASSAFGSTDQSKPFAGVLGNGASRTRTGDLLGAIQALSQLSYSPVARASMQARNPSEV